MRRSCGPLLLIDANYSGQTGNFPPVITGVSLTGWTVSTCRDVWTIGGEAGDPVGTVRLRDIAVGTMTGSNSAQYISDLEVAGVTVGGKPVTP